MKVYQVILEALHLRVHESYRINKINSLNHMRQLHWPDLKKMELVQLTWACEPNLVMTVWSLQQAGDELILLHPDFRKRKVMKSWFTKIETCKFEEELAALMEYLRTRKPGDHSIWDYRAFHEHQTTIIQRYGGRSLLHFAYSAALFDKPIEARQLIHEALRQTAHCFRQADDGLRYPYDRAAEKLFHQGIAASKDGPPGQAMLDLWKQTVREYPVSHSAGALRPLIEVLEKQVIETERLAKTKVAEPEKLPLEARIKYYIARLPEVRGSQDALPGECRVVGGREGTEISDALVKIGRRAMPALIECLHDLRVTRSTGLSFAGTRVLRVQDVAIQCLERITEIRFHHASYNSYLSNKMPAEQTRVINSIHDWWKQNRDKSQLDGYLARLDKDSIYHRLTILNKIEKLDPSAVDSIAVLKRWADNIDYRLLPTVAKALAKRGDMSLLPAIRKVVRHPTRKMSSEAVWFLARHGNVDDIRFLRQTAREDVEMGSGLGSTRIWGGRCTLVSRHFQDRCRCRSSLISWIAAKARDRASSERIKSVLLSALPIDASVH